MSDPRIPRAFALIADELQVISQTVNILQQRIIILEQMIQQPEQPPVGFQNRLYRQNLPVLESFLASSTQMPPVTPSVVSLGASPDTSLRSARRLDFSQLE